MLAILIVSACAAFGPLLSPLMRRKTHGGALFMAAFWSLGVGVLVGDALVHLIPAAFGIHSHDHESGDGDDHEHEEPLTTFEVMGLGLTVFAGIYLFFLIERTLLTLMGTDHEGHSHGHSHASGGHSHGYAFAHGQAPDECKEATERTPLSDTSSMHGHGGGTGEQSVAYMVLVGDAVHNFIDGVVIGVSFVADKYLGFSTLIAIILHEIPHEIGDFAILLNAGISFWRAVGFTALSQLVSFIGGAVGVALGDDPSAQPYLLALTAGIFLYLALVDLVRTSPVPPMLSALSPTPFLGKAARIGAQQV